VYSVSRTKIRTALVMLSKDELVELVPEKGACVTRLGKTEAQEIFAVRRILEAALVREFVAGATSEDHRRLDAHMLLERGALATDDVQLRSNLLADFHILLADIVGNKVLSAILKKLTARISLAAMRYQSANDAACSSDEHVLFIEAARSGDVEEAVRIMMHHLDHMEHTLGMEACPDVHDRDLIAALLA
jgi:DNA-binding GntR family transcriptional regulator